MRGKMVLLFFFFGLPGLLAQKRVPNLNQVDVLKYTINVNLNDTSKEIEALVVAKVNLKVPQKTICFNLVNSDYSGGMIVKKVKQGRKDVVFEHKNDTLKIILDDLNNGIYDFLIFYSGVPKDGLIIGRNMYGNQTFFCDNWPDRAQNWLPCIDHPSDKAKVEFKIKVPYKYRVVANGLLEQKSSVDENYTLYHYQTNYPLPTKVMVFGAADFAVGGLDTVNNIPLSSWVYPQNKEREMEKFDETANALKFFSERIGAYPFQKLASVQSSTIFGGMENAGAIFYPEKRVAGTRRMDETVVHEIVHQWFGNSATETDFSHIWLSEGFATYLTNLYFEEKYGKERLHKMLVEQKRRVIYYYKRRQVPVVDSLTSDYMSLLNPNSYQKGAWVLHMLRKELGDDLFWQVLKTYYESYKYSNASTEDFKEVAEKVSGKELDTFFSQWLYQPGHPIIDFSWKQDKNELKLKLIQLQKSKEVFKFNVELKINYTDNSSEIVSLELRNKETFQKVKLKKEQKIKEIIIDPNYWLLYELN